MGLCGHGGFQVLGGSFRALGNGIVDQPQLPRFKAYTNYDNYVGVGA